MGIVLHVRSIVLGKDAKYVAVSDEDAVKAMTWIQLSEFRIDFIIDLNQCIRKGFAEGTKWPARVKQKARIGIATIGVIAKVSFAAPFWRWIWDQVPGLTIGCLFDGQMPICQAGPKLTLKYRRKIVEKLIKSQRQT